MALSPGSLSFGGRRFLCSVFFRNIAEEESVPACSPAAKRILRRAAPAQSYLDVETTISFKVSLFHTAQCLFFEKRGYFADWVSADLTLNLSQYSTPNIPPSPYDIRFGLPSDKVHAQISNAVEEVDSDWISYFAVFCCWMTMPMSLTVHSTPGLEPLAASGYCRPTANRELVCVW